MKMWRLFSLFFSIISILGENKLQEKKLRFSYSRRYRECRLCWVLPQLWNPLKLHLFRLDRIAKLPLTLRFSTILTFHFLFSLFPPDNNYCPQFSWDFKITFEWLNEIRKSEIEQLFHSQSVLQTHDNFIKFEFSFLLKSDKVLIRGSFEKFAKS